MRNKFPITTRGVPAEKSHPLIKILDIHRKIEGISRAELARRAGLPKKTLSDWWRGANPHIRALEDAFGVFELRLKPTPIEKTTRQLRKETSENSNRI